MSKPKHKKNNSNIIKLKRNKKSKNINLRDSRAKTLLSRKDMVSYILKYFVEEYKDIDIGVIKNSLEEGEQKNHIKTLGSLDDEIKDAKIYYDIFFMTKVPNSNENIALYIDLEPQGGYDLKYKISNRGIYYACRMISRQKGIDFEGQDYDKLHKVYSIWLNIDNSDKAGTTDEILLKHKNSRDDNFDEDYNSLLNVITINIGKNSIRDEHQEAMDLLYLMFIEDKLNVNEKIKIIKTDYDNIDVDKELKDMCTFEEAIEITRKHINFNEGKQEGMRLGAIENAASNVLSYMKSFNLTLEQAIEPLNMDDAMKEAVINKVNELNNNN